MICKIGFLFLAKFHDRKRLEMKNLTILIWISSVKNPPYQPQTRNLSKIYTNGVLGPKSLQVKIATIFAHACMHVKMHRYQQIGSFLPKSDNFYNFTKITLRLCKLTKRMSKIPNTLQILQRKGTVF